MSYAKINRHLLLLCCILTTVSPALMGQLVPTDRDQKFHRYLEFIHQQQGFSGEVLLVQRGDTLLHEVVGMASREHRLPHHRNGKYRIASITKTFTGALVAAAREEGLLNLDDRIGEYLPALSLDLSEVTVGQLLAHTSGLPHHEGMKDYWAVKSRMQMTPSRALAEINALELRSPPGEQKHYSSPGYFILSLVLERAYAQSFGELLAEKILRPLHLSSTGVADNLAILPGMTTGYHLLREEELVVAPYRNYSMLTGAGDMYATATDLLRWTSCFYDDRAAGEISVASAASPLTYGWQAGEGPRQKYFHGGGTWGYSSYVAVYPEAGTSLILLSNVSTLPVSGMGEGFEKILFGEPFSIPALEDEAPPALPLTAYAGTFVADSGKMTLAIRALPQGLFAQLGGNPPFRIYSRGDHQFFGKKVAVEITFAALEGWVTGLSAERMGQRFTFRKAAQ